MVFSAISAQPPEEESIQQVRAQNDDEPHQALLNGLVQHPHKGVGPVDAAGDVAPQIVHAVNDGGHQRQRHLPQGQAGLPLQQQEGRHGRQRIEEMVVQHRAGEQHDVPAVAVLVHGGQNEHHRQKRHGKAAGGKELQPLHPAGQIAPGKKVHQLAQRHQRADGGVEHIGKFGVHGHDDLRPKRKADGQGDGLHVHDGQIQCQRSQRTESMFHLILPC